MHDFEVWVVLSIAIASGMIGWLIGRVRFCAHPWELVDKTEVPSLLEQLRVDKDAKLSWRNYDIVAMSRRTVILALRCPRCGAAQIHRDGP